MYWLAAAGFSVYLLTHRGDGEARQPQAEPEYAGGHLSHVHPVRDGTLIEMRAVRLEDLLAVEQAPRKRDDAVGKGVKRHQDSGRDVRLRHVEQQVGEHEAYW